MQSTFTRKDEAWKIEAFKGLAFNELLAREHIAARMQGDEKAVDAVMKAIRFIK